MRVSTKWIALALLPFALFLITGCEYLEELPFEKWHGGHGSGDADADGDGDDDPCKPLLDQCETAFAYGDNSFVDLGLTNGRWGWQLGPIDNCNCNGVDPEPFSEWVPIYAAAGRNDISKGVEVGRLHYYYDGEWAIIYYGLWPGYELDEVHTYVDTMPIEKLAPGQFGHSAEGDQLDGPDNHRFAVRDFGCEPIYIVAHAVVCPADWNGDPSCEPDPCRDYGDCPEDPCDNPDGCDGDPCDNPDGCDGDPCDNPDGCTEDPCEDPELCDDEWEDLAPV